MRTQTLLIASAVALAAAVTSSQAQTVYSANIVGYVNIALPAGQNVLAAPALDLDGTGTNGTISTVVGTNVDKGTTVLVWNGTGYNDLEYTTTSRSSAPGWFTGSPFVSAANYPLNVGEGFFISDPGPNVTNFTETGIVLQGTLTNAYVGAAGVNELVGSDVPVGGDITTNLNYIANKGDTILIWNGTGYNDYEYTTTSRTSAAAWYTGSPFVQQDPQISVGQGFFLSPEVQTAWVETFTNN